MVLIGAPSFFMRLDLSLPFVPFRLLECLVVVVVVVEDVDVVRTRDMWLEVKPFFDLIGYDSGISRIEVEIVL